MSIRTIEDNFDHQTESILKTIYSDYKEQIEESEKSFVEWLWSNRSVLGEAFFEKVDEYMSMDEVCESIES